MPTISYNDAIKEMIAERPEMATQMFEGAINTLLAGEMDDARLLLREYVNVTIGFQELARRTGKIDKNLMRTLSADGNPTAMNLMAIIRACADAEDIAITAHVAPKAKMADLSPTPS